MRRTGCTSEQTLGTAVTCVESSATPGTARAAGNWTQAPLPPLSPRSGLDAAVKMHFSTSSSYIAVGVSRRCS